MNPDMNTESYWTLVEPVWNTISIYDGEETYLAQYQAAPEVSRVLFAAHWFQSEVRNGGFGQFFYNATGILAPEAAAAFRTMGMTRTGDLIVRAMALFKGHYPRDRRKREEALKTLGNESPDDLDAMGVMDEVIFDLLDTEQGGFEAAADRYAANWRKSSSMR
jgi:hypothetical protein